MGFNGQINESIRSLNWHEQHIKSDLDSKITPLCQAAYLGRKRVIEMMLENYTYLDLNLSTKGGLKDGITLNICVIPKSFNSL